MSYFAFDLLAEEGFPLLIEDPAKIFLYEKNFEKWLLDRGYWFWRCMGLEVPEKNNSVTPTPDLLTYVNSKGKNKIRFGIEVEHAAKNFITHKHCPSNIHLIISLYCSAGHYNIKGVPIISLYRKCEDGLFHYSLEHDIGVIFHDEQIRLF